MYDCDYYPQGAYNDPKAPYNEVEVPDIEVKCEVSITLTKKDAPVFTDNYINNGDEYGDEYEVMDSYQELADKCDDQHYCLTGLLDELAKYIRGELQGDITRGRRNELERMLEDCQGWEEGDTDIEDYKV
jgi:hypothetical protein